MTTNSKLSQNIAWWSRQNLEAYHEPESAFSDYRGVVEMLDQVDLDVVYVVTMPGHLLPIVVASAWDAIYIHRSRSHRG